MKTKVHLLTVLVIDHDGLGADSVVSHLENARYPNHCMSPHVKKIETREVEWSDDHPLNQHTTQDAAVARLFAPRRK